MRILSILLLLQLAFPSSFFAQTERLPTEPNWEKIAKKDWLLDGSAYLAGVFRGKRKDELILSNGLLRRSFRLSPNAATVAFDNLMTGEAMLRGVKPEAEITLNGQYFEVGGLKGQPNYAFLLPQWLDTMKSDPGAMRFTGFEVSQPEKPFEWKRVRHCDEKIEWPPKGIHLRMDYVMPPAAKNALNVRLSIHYELYDGIPVMVKWLELKNEGNSKIVLDKFTSEILAAVEYGSTVEAREFNLPSPNIHVETDYAFASMIAEDANHHVVHWETDPDYSSQVNYLRLTQCLLKVSPTIGPSQVIDNQGVFTSFRTFILPHDSYDRERKGLAQRRMYRTLAPWTTENPLMMHARFADWEQVKTAIDQAAEVGFEMVILTFGSGFNIENDSLYYLDKMKKYADYAHSKGVEIGGYSLLASRSVGNGNDVVMPEGRTPVFGNSPCIGSEWGEAYFKKLYHYYKYTGFSLLEHDGSYPGDVCIAEKHPGHRGYEDSQWSQYQTIVDFYQWCRSEGIYLNIPDYYYMAGGNKCGMGYREVNWSLPREQQVIHTRQNIYDGTWTKLVSMGWMFVPLTEYQGGGAVATIEPLNEHLDHYQKMMLSNLSAGVQACYRGPRLYDTEATKNMVSETVAWYKKHREVLEGDLLHLRRADGRDLDYWLMLRPGAKEKAALVVFNPFAVEVEKSIEVPLYYAGFEVSAKVFHQEDFLQEMKLDRAYALRLDVKVAAGDWTVYFFE